MKPKVGEYFSRISYGKVVKINYDGTYQLENEENFSWAISPAVFDAECITASEVTKEEVKSRTDIINLIKENQRVVMTVNFNKQMKKDEAIAKMDKFITDGLYDKSVRDKSGKWTNRKQAISDLVDELVTGENRTLIGRHNGAEDEHGRMRFFDMEVKQPRLVDPRTINWVTIAGVMYIVK